MPRLFMFVVIVFVYIVVAHNILFLEILSVIWTKKNIGKISTHTPFPILIYRTWKIKSPPKKILTPSLFLKTKIYPKKYFWLNETKKKTKRKKLTLENFVPTLKNGLQTKILGWCNFSCKVSFYSESINVQITSATI